MVSVRRYLSRSLTSYQAAGEFDKVDGDVEKMLRCQPEGTLLGFSLG